MQLIEKAIALALEAHAGTVDKSGEPYILHPLRLMMEMDTEDARITAVLHDVVEDSDTTLDDLEELGFPTAVIDALALLTHDPKTVDYATYVEGIRSNALARRVKLADLSHNMDLRRLPAPLTKQDLLRLQRYRQAWDALSRD